MSAASVDATGYRFDALKWLVIVALVIGGAVANSYFSNEFPLIVRVLGMVVIGAVAALIALKTAKGQALWTLAKEAQIEVRKVVWPTNAETNQTTLVVSVVVAIAAVLLWIFDWAIGTIAKYIMG